MKYESNYLSHHGIKGQVWGKRNGPPYPLKPSAHSAKERNLNPSFKGILDEKRKNYDEKADIKERKKATNIKIAQGALLLAMGLGMQVPFMSIGLIAPPAVLLGVTGSATILSGVSDYVKAGGTKKKLEATEKRWETEEVDKKTGFHLKDKEWTRKEDLKAVNPEYHNFSTDTKQNCMLCTTAYELRRRGYDVIARKTPLGFSNLDCEKWFPSSKTEHLYWPDGKKDIQKAVDAAENGMNYKLLRQTKQMLLSQGDAARGNLMVVFPQGSGHSVHYEVRGNKVIISDAQNGKTNGDYLLKHSVATQCLRLDNIDFDQKLVKELIR